MGSSTFLTPPCNTLSSTVFIPSGRWPPSPFDMYTLRILGALYSPALNLRNSSGILTIASLPNSYQFSPSTPAALFLFSCL